MLARPYGVRYAGSPLAELTMLAMDRDGAAIPLACAHRQGRKRSVASSRNALATAKNLTTRPKNVWLRPRAAQSLDQTLLLRRAKQLQFPRLHRDRRPRRKRQPPPIL